MSRRAELVPTIVALRATGLTWKQVGAAVGLHASTAQEYASDPDGTRAYQRKHRTRCATCGSPTYSATATQASGRCAPCHHAMRHQASRAWVIERIQAWDTRFGAPPTASDWNRAPTTRAHHPTSAQRQHQARDQAWPSCQTVQGTFGSWSAAIQAAGYAPLRSGGGRITDRATAREAEADCEHGYKIAGGSFGCPACEAEEAA